MCRVIAVLALTLVAGALAGCGGTRPSKYYQLEVPQVPSAAGARASRACAGSFRP